MTIHTATPHAPARPTRTGLSIRGQSTVEYALVLLGAAAIALLVVSWVTGTDVVGRLFDAVFGHIIRGVR